MPNKCHILFENKGKVAFIGWSFGTLGFLVPTIRNLIPLTNAYNLALQALSDAQNTLDETNQAIKTAKERVGVITHRLFDIDCYVNRFGGFYQSIVTFQGLQAESNFPPFLYLNRFYQLDFQNDWTSEESHQSEQSWYEEYTYPAGVGGQQIIDTGTYIEKYTTLKSFKNIISGSMHYIFDLPCGSFAHNLYIHSPEFYLTYSDSDTKGTRYDGTITHTSIEAYGSYIQVSSTVDGTLTTLPFRVLTEVDNITAALDIMRKINSAVATLTAGLLISPQFYQNLRLDFVQEMLRLNQTIIELGSNVITQDQDILSKTENLQLANDEFKAGLIENLPMLFLVPLLIPILIRLGLPALWWLVDWCSRNTDINAQPTPHPRIVELDYLEDYIEEADAADTIPQLV